VSKIPVQKAGGMLSRRVLTCPKVRFFKIIIDQFTMLPLFGLVQGTMHSSNKVLRYVCPVIGIPASFTSVARLPPGTFILE
jgi:hypothetical protein